MSKKKNEETPKATPTTPMKRTGHAVRLRSRGNEVFVDKGDELPEGFDPVDIYRNDPKGWAAPKGVKDKAFPPKPKEEKKS